MKKQRTLKHIPTDNSREMTPKRKEPRDWKEVALKMQQAMRKIEDKMNQFLIDNFSFLLESTFDIRHYFQKVSKLLDDCNKVAADCFGGIFKKIKNVMEPLSNPQISKSPFSQSKREDVMAKIERELEDKESYIYQLEAENTRLKQNLRERLADMEENRQKQNRMTELLYILRKKGVDIDQIYCQSCQTPGISKKTSAIGSSSEQQYA